MNNLSIYHLLRVFVKNILVIILVALVSGVAAFSYCQYFVEEKYAATGSVIVTNGAILYDKDNKSNSVQSSDIAASINLLSTVEDILSTNDIYKRLAEELGGQYTYTQLKNCVKIEKRGDNSLFIDVRFQTSSKSETIKITNTFLELAPAYISKFIPHSASTAVTMADTAVKTAPQTKVTTITAMFIGAIICYAVVYLISLSNVTIENESDFRDRFDIPVLGNIPDFSEMDNKNPNYNYKRG